LEGKYCGGCSKRIYEEISLKYLKKKEKRGRLFDVKKKKKTHLYAKGKGNVL